MVGQAGGTRGKNASRAFIPGTGWSQAPAPGSTARAVAGSEQAYGGETASPDPCDRSDSLRSAGGPTADTASLSYQAPALGLQRVCGPDLCQRRVPLR